MARRSMNVDAEGGLRRAAEERLARGGQPAPLPSEADVRRLLHELEVHQIELELQNEDLRRAHLDLQESRDRYWTLYDHAPVGYLTLDSDGRIFEANLTAAALLGVERGLLVGRALTAFMSADDADVFHRHQREVFRLDEKRGCDVRMRRADGVTFPAHLDSVLRLGQEAARPVPALSHTVLIDLSELRRTQEALRTQESRTQTLLNTAADAIVSADEHGRIESLNAAAEALFGYGEAEVRGRSVRLLLPTAAHESAGRASGPLSHESAGVRKDGTVFPMDITVGEWWDRGERKLIAVVRDISARKQAERELQESESRFRQIAEHIEDLFYVRESNGVLSYLSPAFERIWGRPITELAGNPDAWLETIEGEDRERVAEAWARMRDGEPITETYRIWRPDGQMRWVLSRSFPVLGPEREVLRHVGVVRDITTERKLEADLRRSQKLEAVAALSGGMAHNLRNVLQAVLAFIHVAQKAGTLGERAAHALERAVSTAKRGASLTDQLMTFSRKQELTARPVRVDEAVQEALELLSPLVGSQIEVQVECGAPGAVIMAHPMLLEQILLNLGANARDAMPDGGTLTIATEAGLEGRTDGGAAGPQVKVVVRDTGSGMTPATIAHLFEPFFTTKDVGEGTGLGLATVFALTRGAGGFIEVESTVGTGSAFTLCFPLLRGTAG